MRLDAQIRLQDNYRQTYDIAYARFRSGLDNYLTVLDAERSLFINQQNILQLELAKLVSQIQLYQALGGGASLTAEQITEFNRQREAMRPAMLMDDENPNRLIITQQPNIPTKILGCWASITTV